MFSLRKFFKPDPDPREALRPLKVAAKDAMRRLGVPLVPGSAGALSSVEEARGVAAEVGYPVLIKAAAGGGGRGMKVARGDAELEEAATTVTVAEQVTSPAVAVMVALPGATPVTLPKLFTVATPGSEELSETLI